MAGKEATRSAAMGGVMDERQALATLILWSSGHFDTFDIGSVLNVPESTISRTIYAARSLRLTLGDDSG